jgi:hypothetical protein
MVRLTVVMETPAATAISLLVSPGRAGREDSCKSHAGALAARVGPGYRRPEQQTYVTEGKSQYVSLTDRHTRREAGANARLTADARSIRPARGEPALSARR